MEMAFTSIKKLAFHALPMVWLAFLLVGKPIMSLRKSCLFGVDE
jgi:hypothetical protein